VPVSSLTTIRSGLPPRRSLAILALAMGTKSRERIYGGSVQAAAERAAEARKDADRLAVEAWNKRMLGLGGPAQPSPARSTQCGLSLSRSEMPWLQHAPDRCPRHRAAIEGNIDPRAGAVHAVQGLLAGARLAYKRSHLVALRLIKISASDPLSTWWPDER
jgi:hypothetical protein